MIITSQDRKSITNCFSFTIVDNGHGYSIVDNLTQIEYARYDSVIECRKEFNNLRESIKINEHTFTFPNKIV